MTDKEKDQWAEAIVDSQTAIVNAIRNELKLYEDHPEYAIVILESTSSILQAWLEQLSLRR